MRAPDRLPPSVLVLLASLYCAQGLPSGLVAHAMPVLLRQHGVDLAWIGLLKLLALPWLLKVLWAPWIDRMSSDRLGHHRGWVLPLQSGVVGCLAVLALVWAKLFNGQCWAVFMQSGIMHTALFLVPILAIKQDYGTPR